MPLPWQNASRPDVDCSNGIRADAHVLLLRVSHGQRWTMPPLRATVKSSLSRPETIGLIRTAAFVLFFSLTE